MSPTAIDNHKYIFFTVKIRDEERESVKNIHEWRQWTGLFDYYKNGDGEKIKHTIESVEAHMREHFYEEHYKRFKFGLFGDYVTKGPDCGHHRGEGKLKHHWEFIKVVET